MIGSSESLGPISFFLTEKEKLVNLDLVQISIRGTTARKANAMDGTGVKIGLGYPPPFWKLH